ncbi:hypothetical protein ACXZ1K_14985 [Pedobacter sp. PWIIR3]
MKANLIKLFFVITLFSVASCSNTKLLTSYAAPEGKIKKNNKILVIAMMSDKDKKLRENMENIMVQTLRAQGIDAGSSIAQYGVDAFKNMDEKTTLQKLKEQNFDGTFTIALLKKTKESDYRPGYISYGPNPYRFWGYYHNMYSMIYRPGYYTDKNQFVLEGTVYNLGSDKLLYSAQTKTINPDSPYQLASTFTKTLLSDMAKNGVFSN